jgi:hypothetical protein
MTASERVLSVLLRVCGAVAGLAVVAVFMPRVWIGACHECLGLGPFPDAPVAEYLARSLSMFYALAGVVFWLLGGDVRRNRRAIGVAGAAMVVSGLVLLVIDLRAGMPGWWVASEGPWAVVLGAVILALRARAGAGTQGAPRARQGGGPLP